MIITPPEPATEAECPVALDDAEQCVARGLGLRPFTEREITDELQYLFELQLADKNQL